MRIPKAEQFRPRPKSTSVRAFPVSAKNSPLRPFSDATLGYFQDLSGIAEFIFGLWIDLWL